MDMLLLKVQGKLAVVMDGFRRGYLSQSQPWLIHEEIETPNVLALKPLPGPVPIPAQRPFREVCVV